MAKLKMLFTFIFLLLYIETKAGVGMGDWQCTTPGKNTIDNYSGQGIALFLRDTLNYHRIENLTRWYFYKGFIIAEQSNKRYFVANEKTLEVDSFSNKKQWLNRIEKLNLKPSWMRWYNDNWTFYADIEFYLFIFFYISIPLIVLFLMLLYRSVRFERLNIRKPATIIIVLTLLFILTTYVLEQFPQSV